MISSGLARRQYSPSLVSLVAQIPAWPSRKTSSTILTPLVPILVECESRLKVAFVLLDQCRRRERDCVAPERKQPPRERILAADSEASKSLFVRNVLPQLCRAEAGPGTPREFHNRFNEISVSQLPSLFRACMFSKIKISRDVVVSRLGTLRVDG